MSPAYFDFTIDLCKAKTPLRQRDPTSPLSNNGPVKAASAAHSWGQHILPSLDGRSLFNCGRILGNVRQNQVRSTRRAWSLPLSGPTRRCLLCIYVVRNHHTVIARQTLDITDALPGFVKCHRCAADSWTIEHQTKWRPRESVSQSCASRLALQDPREEVCHPRGVQIHVSRLGTDVWGAENAKDTLCRNVLIYGHCRYEDQGCAFNHDPNKTLSAQPDS
jgi:hypothetical protein